MRLTNIITLTGTNCNTMNRVGKQQGVPYTKIWGIFFEAGKHEIWSTREEETIANSVQEG